MTAENFNRLDELRKDMLSLRERLSDLRNASAVSAVNYSGTGGNGGTGDSVADTAAKIVDIESEIMRCVLAMVEIIDTVPSPKTRRIMRHRYINGFTWNQIADAMGYVSADGPKKRFRGYKRAVFVPPRTPCNGVK